MKVKVIGKTSECSLYGEEANTGITPEFMKITGQCASVCYADSCDVDKLVMTQGNAESLAKKVLGRGHTSVAEHYNITIAFENIPKIIAMILNSVQIYSTSERSGRYTTMFGDTERERELYNKWLGIYENVIRKENPDINEMTCKTRARENARYVLSIFATGTSMVYTANMRQWHLVMNLFAEYIACLSNTESSFNLKLMGWLTEVRNAIHEAVGQNSFPNGEDKYQSMFTRLQSNHPMRVEDDEVCADVIGDMYSVTYEVSYCQLAQIQRHRALKYFVLSELKTNKYYIPEIIKGTAYEQQWVSDLMSIEEAVPQATMLRVNEVGFAGDFLKKCEERLCGRAMLETMLTTKDIMYKFKENKGNMRKGMQMQFEKWFDTQGELKPKCAVKGLCKESCAKLGITGTPLCRKV